MSETDRRHKVILSIGIVVFVLISCVIVGILRPGETGDNFFESFDDFDVNEQPWTECPLALPDKSCRIVFLRRHRHPFLAEYDRKIRCEVADRVTVKSLPTNSGGKTKINVYYYAAHKDLGPFIRLRDRYGNYRFDLGNGVEEIAAIPESVEGEYMGRLDGSQGPLRFISVQESPEERIEQVG